MTLSLQYRRRPRLAQYEWGTRHARESGVVTEAAALLYVGPWMDVNRAGTVSGLPVNGYSIVTLAGSYNLGDWVSDTTKKPLVTCQNR
jgi:hypothetical protein